MAFEFSKFLTLLNQVSCSPDEQGVLQRVRSAGGKYTDFAKLLEDLPESKQALLTSVSTLFESRLKEKLVDPTVALSMIGFNPARNFLVAAIACKRTDTKGPPPFDNPNHPMVRKLLQFAIQAEAQGGEQFAADYYFGGLAYDILVQAIFPERGSEEESALVDPLIKQGIATAKLATQLSSQLVPKMNLEKELCVDGILHDVGKLGFLAIAPEGQTALADQPVLAESQYRLERTTHQTSSEALGYLLLSKLGSGGSLLGDTRWVTYYHHQPFLARRKGASIFARATLIWVADHILRYREHHGDLAIPRRMIANWHRCCLPALPGIDSGKFKEIVSAVPAPK